MVVCGCLFIINKFNSKNECITEEKLEEENQNQNSLVEDLTTCQNDLFKKTNDLEQLKVLPDTRKDIIKLLLISHEFEKKIGFKNDFSNECIKFFTIASRISSVQEYVLKYKNQLFENNCNFSTNNDIIKMIIPFQIKFLDIEKENEKNKNKDEKIIPKILNEIKYKISKLFVKSNIQKSELEISIENSKYDEALQILRDGKFEITEEFNKLYNSISTLKNTTEMIEGVYNIVKNNN